MGWRQFYNQAKPHFNLNNGVLLIALLIASGWVWNTVEAIQRNFQLQQKVDLLRQELSVLELQNKTIDFQNKYYKSDEFLELSARERLNKAGKGEKLLMLPANTKHAAKDEVVLVDNLASTPISERSNLDQWMYFLFGKDK